MLYSHKERMFPNMVKIKSTARTHFQMVYKWFLVSAVLLFAFFHVCLTFTRHYFTPENMMFSSDSFMIAMKVDRWYALCLILATIVYLFVYKRHSFRAWDKLKSGQNKVLSKEWIVLLIMQIWYIICCWVYSRTYSNYFQTYDWFLFDFAACALFFFPLALAVGHHKIQKYVDILLHVIIIISTGFIVWALWNLFHLNIVTLPNGLPLGMTQEYTFYPGVNENIGAAIGTSMVMISLYMIATHRWPIKLLYFIVMLPHLFATLLTGSRANFLALFIAFTLFSFMLVWNKTKMQSVLRCILLSTAAAVAAGAAIVYFRTGVFQLFDYITNLSSYISASPEINAHDSLLHDSGRLPIWYASLKMMVSSIRTFFFGYPIFDISQTIKDTLIQLYGSGSAKAHAHNIILQTGLVMGIPGMLMFIAFLVMMVFRCVRVGIGKAKGNLHGAYVLPIIILTFIVVNMFEPFLLFYCSIMACLFFFFCGWIIAIDRDQ